MRLQELIVEGRHDPHIFKAIFMMGVPGSGKTAIAKRLIAGTGLKMVNSDSVYEWLTMKSDTPILTKGYEDELYRHSNRLVRKQMDNYIDGRLGLLIDSTGKKIERTIELKQRLESLGYETMAVFVNADILTSLDRNDMRKRRVDPSWIRAIHGKIQNNLGMLQKLFGGDLIIVDNSEGASLAAVVPHQQVQTFLRKPSRRPPAKKWLGENVRLQSDYGEQLRELSDIITEQCQPWIQEIGGMENFYDLPFYRGIKNAVSGAWEVRPVRQDRRPSDSPKALHEFFNRIIAQSGKVANRSNSLFAYGEPNRTLPYGATHVVIPLGDFHYTWSTEMQDWYGNALDYVTYSDIMNHRLSDASLSAQKYTKALTNSIRGDDGSLLEARQSGHEVMIYSSHAILIDHHAWADLVEHHFSKA